MIGMLQELGIWRPLRRRRTSLTSMMIVSIGLALAARYLFLFFYGGGSEAYSQYTLQPDPVAIGPVDLAPRSLWVIGLSALVIVAVALFLLKARFGKAIRAVSDNPELASSSGIDADRVILIVWVLGGALAGLGGIFYGLEFGVKWDMGFTLLLLMFAAITLGGLGNPFGALARQPRHRDLRRALDVDRPQRQRPEDGRGTRRPDPRAAGPTAGAARQPGAGGMNWELIFWNAVYTGINAAAAAYCLIAIGLNVHVGYTGLLNFGQAGFAAIGAYAFAVPIAEYGWEWYAALPLVFVASILFALLLGLPTLRLRADYLAIVTIAAAEIVRYFLNSSRFTWLTGGSNGKNGWTGFFQDLNPFPNDARYSLGAQPIDGYRLFMLLLGWGLVAVISLFVWALMRSPWGRVLKSIREDENAARALGKNVLFFKMQSLILGGVIGSIGGLMLAAQTQSAQPGQFATTLTFFCYVIIVLGRAGPSEGAHHRHRDLLLRHPARRQRAQPGHPPGQAARLAGRPEQLRRRQVDHRRPRPRPPRGLPAPRRLRRPAGAGLRCPLSRLPADERLGGDRRGPPGRRQARPDPRRRRRSAAASAGSSPSTSTTSRSSATRSLR